ncbi:uncharacterized protein LOC142327940 isoform X2 [Lycorma delicatula]|uniref:uncharacterized protein LOC142327940 isoform X2 n=1 Tax=Lycorma delicatula TaxID=130591 RepID=UPI003F51136C
MGTEDNNYDKERGRALATLRGILVSSLSRENLPLDLDDSLSPTSPPVPPTRRRRRVTFLEGGVTTEHHNGSIDAGAAPVDPSQKQTSRPSSAKQGGLHWFAHGADEPVSSFNEGKENAAVTQKDREERLRLLKERQNEDRQRKLEELKQQALAAQKFREQKEEERRRRMEELRLRDSDRRHQVEERKRQIWEAERDRREAILRKNQEREARIESKRKNERSSIVFAFGSSTPRMLEPADTGGSYWATRRATSTSNVMMLSMTAPPGPLTRRSSERELDGSKKRATSAGGINRNKGEDTRRSSSIYEVFQWDSPPAQSPCCTAPLSPVDNSSPSLSQQSPQQDESTPIKNKSPGDEGDGTSNNMTAAAAAAAAARAAARRKTDLMPTIPSPRDRDLTPGRPQSSRTMRSPGRAYSMSRLDILARPRKRTLQPPSPATPDPNLSRSMTSLAQQQPATLRRANTSRSMSQLSAPIPPPRPTRAERLRRKAREAASRSQSLEQTPTSPGLRSGEATPSRPQSAMSQHSVSSVIGMTTSCTSANIRTRPVAAPRRPRPYSIAVTGISSSSPSDSPRQSLSSEHRAATAAAAASKSANVGGVDKPPLPKVHTTKKPLSAKPDLAKKPADKIKSTKSSATSTPKATPLQSPGIEVPPTSHTDEATSVTTVTSVMTVGDEMHTETVTVAVSETSEQSETVVSHKIENDKPAVPFVESEKIIEDKQQQPQRIVIDKQPTKQDSDIVTHQESSINELPEGDMTASMIARTRITTEEEAKAALAERRRLAREQAEREAELERQRLEAERLAEEERLRQEEEEQRRAEEEQLRLIEEARLAEEQRLQQAIQEAQKREEEERRRREEEERLRKEKEEADRKAKEEAEKLRQEMEIKLKKEEEDRQARRKRVEAIMLRTRGKGATPTNTPTKEDGEEVEESPGEYTKNESKNMNLQEEFLHSERNHSAAVTSAPIIHQPPPASNPFLDSINTPKHNGHRNGVDNETVEQNNVTNNLLDFSSFETTNNVNVNNVAQQPPIGEILQPISADNMPITPTNGKLSNEDNLNFNSQPFIPFQDNKKQDPNTVNDLLS